MMMRIYNLSEDLTQYIVYSLLITFIFGLILVYLQLNEMNNYRNKSTNLGGVVGLFGFGLTPVMIILPDLSVTFPIFIFGLIIASIGIFAEVTRIDEPILFWFKTEFRTIIRYTITTIGFLLINWGFLWFFIWPQEIIGLLGVFLGVMTIYFSWREQINRLFKAAWDSIMNSIKRLVKFLIENRWPITQYVLTFFGVALIWFGLVSYTADDILWLGLIGLGIFFFIVAWHEFLLQLLKDTGKALVKAFWTFIDYIILVGKKLKGFLKKSLGRTIEMVEALLEFLKKAMYQIFDSIIPIISFSVAIIAISYCIFLIIYTVFPDLGKPLDEFLINYIPGVDPVARFIQELTGEYEGKLIGQFGDPNVMYIVVACIIIVLCAVFIIKLVPNKEKVQFHYLLSKKESKKGDKI